MVVQSIAEEVKVVEFHRSRGGSRLFLRRGAPLRNDGEVKKKLKANTYIRRRKLLIR